MTPPPRLLGIDAGFASIGYSIVELGDRCDRVVEMGLIRTEPSSKKRKVLAAEDNVRRTREIAKALIQLHCSHKPKALCCETMSFPRNSSSAAKMAMFWGVLIALAHTWGLPIIQATPQEIKKACCGAKNASKDEVEAALRKRYRTTPWIDLLDGMPPSLHNHAWDALGATATCLDSDTILLLRQLVT